VNGILSMPAEKYHAAEGVSRSMLEYISGDYSPAHFAARFITKEASEEETPALKFGSIFHRCLLEPETADGAFYVKPEKLSYSTIPGKEWRSVHADRPVISAAEAATIKGAHRAVWRHPVARQILEGSQREQSMFAIDAKGTLRKGRLDALNVARNAIGDVKTCERADEESIGKAIVKYGYHRQAYWYEQLCKLLGMDCAFALIFVEKSPPFDVVCHTIDDEDMDIAADLVEHDLQTYRNCMESGKWPGRSNGLTPAALPGWYVKKFEGRHRA
jgi:hypothetical protein